MNEKIVDKKSLEIKRFAIAADPGLNAGLLERLEQFLL